MCPDHRKSLFIVKTAAGPLLAFFIWLALITSAQVQHLSGDEVGATDQCFGPSRILCPDEFVNFLIAIGMLVGGLIATSKLGGAIGGAAGSGMARINQGKALVKTVGKAGAFKAGRSLDTLQSGIQKYGAKKIGLSS